MENNFNNPYGDQIQVNESPFKAFMGRNAANGTWWFQNGDVSSALTAWKGIVVDGALYRVTGSNKAKTLKAKSNLCSPIQKEIKVMHETVDDKGNVTQKEQIGIGVWKELKPKTSVGQFTKVVAVILLEVTKVDGTVEKVNTLTEVRVRGTQSFLYNTWISDEGLVDWGIQNSLMGSDGNLDKNNEGWTNSKFKISVLTDKQLAPYKESIKGYFDEIEEYVAKSDPSPKAGVATNPVVQEDHVSKQMEEPSSHPMNDGSFPKASDEPAETEEDSDDLPF